jgi:hypothetical protein
LPFAAFRNVYVIVTGFAQPLVEQVTVCPTARGGFQFSLHFVAPVRLGAIGG